MKGNRYKMSEQIRVGKCYRGGNVLKSTTYLMSFILIIGLFTLNGCKDFLNIKPQKNISGNNYWKSEQDVEQFTLGLYSDLRDKVAVGTYFTVIGDLRGGPWVQNFGGRDYITYLANNQINTLLETGNWNSTFHFREISDWHPFYQIIQDANREVSKIESVPDPSFTAKQRKKYKAEAIFIRSLCYFFMVRVYGDVPYYTNPDQTAPLGRMDMIKVFQNCIKELKPVTDDLPWTYDDPSKRGVRAMRGGVLVLMMHMNMWMAGFDEANEEKYWKATDSLGQYLLSENGGAYELLPMKDYTQIFDGRSKEGLFEIPQNLNYGESFGYATFSDLVLKYPHKQPRSGHEHTYMYPRGQFLNRIFSGNGPDLRVQYWYGSEAQMHNKDNFEFLKFINVFAEEGENVNPNDNKIVFRLSDAILLRAEALNDLGKDDEAREMVNLVRARAKATPIGKQLSGDKLSTEIFWERCRELLGEGYYYYDLVRTKRIINDDYCSHPIPFSAFKKGAWTWPIDPKAQDHNPLIRLNDYWVN